MNNTQYFEFSAVKGLQAGKPYYVIMCPLNIVAKLFRYDDGSLPPEMRAQRVLNKPAISGLLEEISLYSRFEALLKKCQIRRKIAFYNNTLVC